jgi:sulfur-oxidizing protein SoxY
MTMNTERRMFLRKTLVSGLAGNAVVIGLLSPRAAYSLWDQNAFGSRTVSDGMKNGLGSSDAVISDDIQIDAPDIAADGATVRVAVEAKLADVESIALLSEKNPRPLCYIFRPGPGVKSKMTLRIKMGESGDVVAVVKAGGKLYMARRNVTVTAGGCA